MDSTNERIESDDLITQARTSYNAFALLYRRHYDAIFKYCVHRLFDRDSAEDITSQVFLKAVEKFEFFEGDEQQFHNWLYRIAVNAVNSHLRKTARRKSLLKVACERANNNANCAQPSEKLAVLKSALLSLKPRYQTIITLRFFENLRPTEIAEVLGSSPGTIRSQLARALAKLREQLSVGKAAYRPGGMTK